MKNLNLSKKSESATIIEGRNISIGGENLEKLLQGFKEDHGNIYKVLISLGKQIEFQSDYIEKELRPTIKSLIEEIKELRRAGISSSAPTPAPTPDSASTIISIQEIEKAAKIIREASGISNPKCEKVILKIMNQILKKKERNDAAWISENIPIIIKEIFPESNALSILPGVKKSKLIALIQQYIPELAAKKIGGTAAKIAEKSLPHYLNKLGIDIKSDEWIGLQDQIRELDYEENINPENFRAFIPETWNAITEALESDFSEFSDEELMDFQAKLVNLMTKPTA